MKTPKPIEYAEEAPEIPQPPSHFDETGRDVSLVGVLIDRTPGYHMLSSALLQIERFKGWEGAFWKW